jgi:uncharacterized membrane protein
MRGDRAIVWLRGAVIAVGVLAVIGMVVLWPRGDAPDLGIRPTTYVDATVRSIDVRDCDSIEVPGALSRCRVLDVELTSGDRSGNTTTVTVLDTQLEVPELHDGDRIVLLDTGSTDDATRYTFVDFQRGTPLIALTVLFVVVVIAFGRLRGLRALVGLLASAAVLVLFIVPALLRDSPALPVALVGTVVIAFLALYLAHGLNVPTTVALAGTLVSLLVIALLSLLVSATTHLTGLGDDAAQTLRITAADLDLRGLLIAGMIVGALGVLDDVTVTQVSAVQALLRARPDLPRRALYSEAIHIGRDHIASTVNTLILAYAGAALPLLLFFAEGVAPTSRIITGELVAVEIVRMMVGSIGLVLSVPITTALAAVIVTPAHAMAGHSHGHDDALPVATSDAADPPDPQDAGSERGAVTDGRDTDDRDPDDWDRFGPRDELDL